LGMDSYIRYNFKGNINFHKLS